MEILTTSELKSRDHTVCLDAARWPVKLWFGPSLGLPGSVQKTTPTSPSKGHKLRALLNVTEFPLLQMFYCYRLVPLYKTELH